MLSTTWHLAQAPYRDAGQLRVAALISLILSQLPSSVRSPSQFFWCYPARLSSIQAGHVMSRKKTLSQHIVHLATPGLPKAAKNVIGSRWGARLTLGLLATLACSGIVTIEWEGRRPHAKLNRERIGQIRTLADQAKQQVSTAANSQAPGSEQSKPRGLTKLVASRRDQSTIKVASFNIQVFGTSKAKNSQVMQILADTVRRFDVVAIQELRTTDEGVMRGFVDLINSEGGAYEYVVGPRLGRSNSKEQYVFVFDTNRLEIDPSSVITIEDPQDHLHREPLIARFRTKTAPMQQPFSFILVNIHTDPDETKTELDALGHVYQAVQKNGWREDDVILLGDLNVSHKKLGLLGKVPDITYTVHGEPTNTRGTKSYDNIVFTRTATSEYTGQSGILDLQSEYSLSKSQALKVSDHLPVWAEFSITEAGASRFAANRGTEGQQKPADAQVAQQRAPAPQPNESQPAYQTAQEPQRSPSRLTGWLRDQQDQGVASQQPIGSQQQVETQGPGIAEPPSNSETPRRRRFGFRRSRLFTR